MPRLVDMRILHTSDWHLGRSFHNVGMAESQQHAIDFIVETIKQHDVGVVMISGDVYDRALPPVDAVAMFDQALVDMVEAGAKVIVTSGNHDSAIRLGFMSRMMSNVYIRTQPETITEPIMVAEDVAIWTVPYLDPRQYAAQYEVEPNHTAVMQDVMNKIIVQIMARNLMDAHHILMAHVFAAGGSGSESERNIGEGEVGTLGQVPLDVFEGMDYVALGHLHGRQTMSSTVRYSGSPVAYSFSEANHTKGMWLLDTDGGQPKAIDIPQLKPLAVLKDDIARLLEADEYAWAEEAWCQITVTDPKRPPHAFRRLKERFPGMLNFILAPSGPAETTTTYSQRLAKSTTDHELILDFVDHVRNRPASPRERDWLTEAIEHVNRKA